MKGKHTPARQGIIPLGGLEIESTATDLKNAYPFFICHVGPVVYFKSHVFYYLMSNLSTLF